MKTGLKRIEATLDQLNAQENPSDKQSDSPSQHRHGSQAAPKSSSASRSKATGKTLAKTKATIEPFPFPQEPQSLADPVIVQPAQPKPARNGAKSSAKPKKPPASKGTRTAAETVQPFPAGQNCSEAPPLPKAKPPSFSSHRHAVNPNLAVGLLKEVEAVVLRWQLDLEQTILEIQALYLEGPIVDGWLESHPYGSPQVMQAIGTATLRHAEIDRLMEYVEEICRVPQTLDLGEVPRTGYRLCGLDADGQLWSRPCPPQQVPYVSLAIARYQKLRILLAKKQNLETRLNQLIQNLTMLHGQMQE
jgi:hypothetical protein